MYILLFAERYFDEKEEYFGEEATCPYHIDSIFWRTAYDKTSQTER